MGRDAELPAPVVVLAEPVGVVEGRVGEELSFASQKTRRVASRFGFHAHARRGVGAEVGMQLAAEGVGMLGAEVGLDAAQGEVHDGEAAGVSVALLAVDADVAEARLVCGEPELGLEAEGGSAGVVGVLGACHAVENYRLKESSGEAAFSG